MTQPLVPADVVHETIDGEAILINLATGTYFNLEGTGAEIWTRLVRGDDPARIAAELAAAHGADAAAVHAEIARLATELHRHGILTAPPDPAPEAAPGASLGTFTPPVLGVHTDMEQFLLVDPIHDVEVAGWPHGAGGAT
jgi:hypothetical protein